MTKILIIEDQTLLRESLGYLLNKQDDMQVVGETDDAAMAPDLCRRLKPDLVLMDVVTKNNSSGITYARKIRKEFSRIKVVIMTGLPEITFVEEARKAGAHSFIYKEMGNEHLLHVLRVTMKGYSVYSGSSEHLPFAARFTEKEMDVIRLVCQGMSREEIAKKLKISESMVKHHVTTILDKTGFDSISKFAIYALGQGLVAPKLSGQNSQQNA